MGKIVKAIFGGGAPKASQAPVQELEGASRKAKKSRAALFETSGGIAGQELNAGGVQSRNTLLGN